jgi:hypothetical protein
MNLLDEQVRADQRLLLNQWRIPFRQIGKDVAASGIKDENIIPFLHGLKHPTFFTHDKGFFERKFLHPNYCLIWLDVDDTEAAVYIRRLLRHPRFHTQAKRMGLVGRAHHRSIHFWQRNRTGLQQVSWQASD